MADRAGSSETDHAPAAVPGEATFGAFLGTKDEVDILPTTIANLRRIGVSLIIVFDRGSTDGTLDFLAAEEARGDIWVIQGRLRDRERPVGRMRSELAKVSGVDWMLFLDSDELWMPKAGSLHAVSDLSDADVLIVMRYNVVLGPEGPCLPDDLSHADDLLLYAQPIPDFRSHLRGHPETPWIRGLVEPKVMARPSAIERMWAGNHDVDTRPGRSWRRALARDVLVAHVPFRTPDMFRLRARNVRQAIARKPGWFTGGMAWQWVRWAEAAESEATDDEFARQAVGPDELDGLRRSGIVRSASDVLAEPLWMAPAADGTAGERAQPGISAAEVVRRREGIPYLELPRPIPTRRGPTVLIPPDKVVTIYDPSPEREAEHARALEALRILGRDPALAVPTHQASGSLDHGWRYIVTPFNPGVRLAAIREEVSPASLSLLVRWLGRLVAQVGAVPLHAEEREAAARPFRDLIAKRRRAVRGVLIQRLGIAPGVASRLAAALPRTHELMPSAADMVMTLGDITADHILGTWDEGTFEPTSIVGLSEARIGHPLFELGPIWWSVIRGERPLLEGFLREWQTPASADPGFSLRALTWALLNPGRDYVTLPEPRGWATLDELAERLFGPL